MMEKKNSNQKNKQILKKMESSLGKKFTDEQIRKMKSQLVEGFDKSISV